MAASYQTSVVPCPNTQTSRLLATTAITWSGELSAAPKAKGLIDVPSRISVTHIIWVLGWLNAK